MLEGDRGEGVVREDHHRPLVDQGQQCLHSLDVFHTILCLLEPIHVWVREVEWVLDANDQNRHDQHQPHMP